MGQVHLVKGPLAGDDVHLEAGVLHRVAREVLHAGHHMVLKAPGKRGGHLAHMAGVLAVGLLGPAPPRMAQQVHAHRPGERSAAGAQLSTDRLTDALLEARIEGRPAGHRHRERGGRPHHAAPGPVGEGQPRDAESLDAGGRPGMGVVAPAGEIGQPGPERQIAVETTQLLLQGHLRHQPAGLGARISASGDAVGGFVKCSDLAMVAVNTKQSAALSVAV